MGIDNDQSFKKLHSSVVVNVAEEFIYLAKNNYVLVLYYRL